MTLKKVKAVCVSERFTAIIPQETEGKTGGLSEIAELVNFQDISNICTSD